MYIYGRNVIEETLKNKEEIKRVFLQKGFRDEQLLSQLERQNILIYQVDKYELDKLVKGNHQGIVALVEEYQYCDIDEIIKENGLLVLLDHIEDPHNFGAIIRTCEAAGVDGIIIPKNRTVEVNSTVIKVSTGAIKTIKIAQVTNITRTILQLKKKGYWIVGSDLEGTNYHEIDYRGSTAIIIGNEGKGMSRIVKEACDFITTIPMNGKTNSLNASVATGIIVFEAARQRR